MNGRAAAWARVALCGALSASVLACGPPARGTIGAVLGRRGDGRVFLREVPEHLAAAKADLHPDDELLLVDGRDVRTLTESELREALEGGVGEEVKLTLLRGDKVIRATLKRSMAEPYRVR